MSAFGSDCLKSDQPTQCELWVSGVSSKAKEAWLIIMEAQRLIAQADDFWSQG